MQTDIDMKNRIRVLRAEKRWSQAELAERVRVSRNSINAIENGRFDPFATARLSHRRRLRPERRGRVRQNGCLNEVADPKKPLAASSMGA